MIQIIGVRFRKSGKVYYFSPADMEIAKGNHVIVETVRGVEYGTVVLEPKEVTDDKIVQPLKPVIRVATPEDDAANIENEAREKEAFDVCLEKIAKHELNMKLIDSEYTFDRNKLLFYFTADGRIDFRELVKDLAAIFRTRIELRQIGVRDETKMLGGIAICGRPLCCHTFLSDFAPVSIKMAKEQNLSLNPAKISGVCGRLMCCLKNEEDAYEYLNSRLPNVGTKVTTIDGYVGEVQNVSVLKQRVKLIISHDDDEKEIKEYSVDDLSFKNHRRSFQPAPANPLPDEEIDENALQELEKMELQDLEDNSIEDEDNPPKTFNKRKRSNNKNQRNNYRNSEDGYRQNQRGNYRNGEDDRQNQRGSYRNGGDDYKQNQRGGYRSSENDRQNQRSNYHAGEDDKQNRPFGEEPKKPYYKKNYNRGHNQNNYGNNEHTESGTGRKYGRSAYRNNSRSYSNRNKKG